GPCPVQTPGPTTLPEPEVTFIPSPSFGQRNLLSEVDTIVMHTTEINLAGTINIFEDRRNSVSSHYVIGGGGDIFQMVDLQDSAWHATYYNSRSIGIEMVGFAGSRATWNENNIAALVDLLAWLYQAYPDIPLVHPSGDAYDFPNDTYTQAGLVAHSQVQPWNKSDPGPHFPWDDVLDRVGAILDAEAVPEPSSVAALASGLVLLAARRRRVAA
ncbi:MAG: N-acetylmuramoyl-L-alanine amidase, partial [Planctomycetota bacterium]